MKMVLSKSLPRRWTGHPKARGVLAEADISPLGYGRRGRLKAKLLVFDTPDNLARFWDKALGSKQLVAKRKGAVALGAVNPLSIEEYRFTKRGEERRLHVDPRYFCLIGLTQEHLSMTVISHESVHAGFAYEKRVQRNVFGKAADFDEERIAYPSGNIASGINRFLYDAGLYREDAA